MKFLLIGMCVVLVSCGERTTSVKMKRVKKVYKTYEDKVVESCEVNENDLGALVTCGVTSVQLTNGVDGLNGADGQDGTNGVDGTNGTNGTNGVDSADFSLQIQELTALVDDLQNQLDDLEDDVLSEEDVENMIDASLDALEQPTLILLSNNIIQLGSSCVQLVVTSQGQPGTPTVKAVSLQTVTCPAEGA